MKMKNKMIDLMNSEGRYKNPKYCWKANQKTKYIISLVELLATSHARMTNFIKKLYNH